MGVGAKIAYIAALGATRCLLSTPAGPRPTRSSHQISSYRLLWVGKADDAASNASPRVSDRLASIINLGMNNYCSTDDRILQAHYRNVVDRELVVRLPLVVGLNVPEVASMAVLVFWQTMLVALRVVVSSSAHPVGR